MKKWFVTFLLTALAFSSLDATGFTAIYAISGVDAKGVRHVVRGLRDRVPWSKDLLKLNNPAWRSRIVPGSTGVWRMTIDPATGKVTKVTIVVSTGNRMLDYNIRSSMYEWRWRPGTWQWVEMPVHFAAPGEVIPLREAKPFTRSNR